LCRNVMEVRPLPVPPSLPPARAAVLLFGVALGLSGLLVQRLRGPGALRRADDVLAQLPDAGLLADLPAEVVQLRAVHVADRGDLDLLDLRRVQRERAL